MNWVRLKNLSDRVSMSGSSFLPMCVCVCVWGGGGGGGGGGALCFDPVQMH